MVVVAPKDELFEKTISNVEEIRARGAKVILISDDAGIALAGNRADHVIRLPDGDGFTLPILAAIPLQLLAYHVAVAKGTDVDQQPPFDQGDGTVLEFAGGIALGVDVGHFLQLQGAFQGQRIVPPPAQVQDIFGLRERLRDFGNLFLPAAGR